VFDRDLVEERIGFQNQKSYQSKLCFRTVVTMIPVNPFPFNNDSFTSCGTVVVGTTRSELEDLDKESIITPESADTDEGMSFGIGRLIIGKTGGGERPCGCSAEVGDSSNKREDVDGEGVPL